LAWSNIAQYNVTMTLRKGVYEKDPDVKRIRKLTTNITEAGEEFTLLEMDLRIRRRTAIAKSVG